MKIIGVALVAAGTLGLVYGGFTYTKGTRQTKIGPLELVVKDRERVDVPVWLGVGAIVAGTALLLFPAKR